MCVSAVSRGDPSGARSPFFEQGVSLASRARSRSCASGSRPRTFLYPVGPPLSDERCVGRRVGVWHDPLWFQILAAPPMVHKILNQLLSCRNPLVPPGPTGRLVPEGAQLGRVAPPGLEQRGGRPGKRHPRRRSHTVPPTPPGPPGRPTLYRLLGRCAQK